MPTWTKPVGPAAPVYTPEGQEMAVMWNRVTLATGDQTLNNVIEFFRLPRGAIVHDVVLRTADLDSGAAGILSVGVPGDTERYIRRVSCQAAGSFRAGNDATATGTVLAANPLAATTPVNLLIQTAPGTPVAGDVFIAAFYTVE